MPLSIIELEILLNYSNVSILDTAKLSQPDNFIPDDGSILQLCIAVLKGELPLFALYMLSLQ